MKLHQRIAVIEEILGHHFLNQRLISSAITHPSAVEGHPVSDSYERLEFLGDSIMGAIVATDLFERFPQMDEGELTRLKISLVSGPMLAEVAEDLGIGELIVFGESERGTGARGMRSALENVYEAVVGALYLDAGYEKAHDFVHRTLGPHITPEIAERPISPKSRLQEVTQRDLHEGPEYKIVGQSGPAHQPTFNAVVLVQGRRIGRGCGGSKKDAESAAAQDALARLGYIEDATAPNPTAPMTLSHYFSQHQEED
ncbi:ribonuclease III [Olegusella massiliensis]|uniref:ribonuclease III n=1 Tax=Olegusella massiliensis TaxID=1776381 RepID=UPI0003ADBE25|nr:ribonuclease III [Olegusella massiliensis]ERL12623.1 ribonuclease III [Coriobacteriaceae bacterium BV3Ac1]MBS5865343.1 ribonuclease III [Coriobacteriaceae bacterium]